MKVNKIEIQNFKGIKNMSHEFSKPITTIVGNVGAGKTSFIQAFRFALTNEDPKNAINKEATVATVAIECDDDIRIERELQYPSKKQIRIMGRKAGTSATESFIEETSSVSSEVMKIATSSEVLSSLKPDQFGALFLNESVEKKTLEDLIKIISSTESKEKKNVWKDYEEEEEEGKLPPDVLTELKKLFKGKLFNLEAINTAYEDAKKVKRDISAQHKLSAAKSKGFTEIVKPEYTEKEINKKYEELIVVEKNVRMYKEQLDNYKKALENKKAYDKRLSELEIAITLNRSMEPDKAEYEKLLKQEKEANEEVVSHSKIQQTLQVNLDWFKKTIAQLDKPVCPISEKLICKTDKTSLKTELNDTIKDIEISLSVVNGKIERAKEKVNEVKGKLSDYAKNKESFTKKSLLIKERDNLLANPIKLPEEPEKISLRSDYSLQKKELKDKLETLREYSIAEKEYKETKVLKRKLIVSEFLVKSLDPKGPVIKAFIETFIDCLEDACNDRARMLKPGFELKLISESGLKVLFKTSTEKDFLPFENLSSGEKIFATVILTDLINSFYDSRVLIIDDTDRLDANSFRLLMSFVSDPEITELYDNIIISCVKHDDIENVIKDYDVDLIKM